MKPELDRVKHDLETIQKAIGLAPAFGRDWMQWLKRDTWLYLWWCLPGLILIAASLAPLDNARRHFGLVSSQWAGILTACVMLGILFVGNRRMTGSDGRPLGLIREYKRVNALSWAFLVPFLLYFIWGIQYGIGGRPFMAGLWLLSGSLTFVAAVCARIWVLLGWAIPLLAFGACQPLLPGKWGGIGLGLMFIATALLCSIIQTWQLRGMEKQNAAH